MEQSTSDQPGIEGEESKMASADETTDDLMDIDIEHDPSNNTNEEVEPVSFAESANHIRLDDAEKQRKRQRSQEDQEHELLQEELEGAEPSNQFSDLSISELRSLAREHGVDISRCIERGDMIESLNSVAARQNDNGSSSLNPDIFQSWSVSQLRACGQAVNCDFQRGATKEDIIQALLEAAEKGPYVANYVNAVAPLMGMNISQLRARAREMHVNVADCLEKGEFIRRLVNAAAHRS
jgi:hypothetical protein